MKIILTATVALLLLTGCAELQQQGSHLKSSLIGLDRKIALYAATGEPIRQWQGRYKVETFGDAARFIHNGKAVYISGTFVVEEM